MAFILIHFFLLFFTNATFTALSGVSFSRTPFPRILHSQCSFLKGEEVTSFFTFLFFSPSNERAPIPGFEGGELDD